MGRLSSDKYVPFFYDWHTVFEGLPPEVVKSAVLYILDPQRCDSAPPSFRTKWHNVVLAQVFQSITRRQQKIIAAKGGIANAGDTKSDTNGDTSGGDTNNKEQITNNEQQITNNKKDVSPDGERQPSPDYKVVMELYNTQCPSLSRVTRLSDSRKKAIRARLNQYSIDDLRQLFEKAEASSFLKGGNNRNWRADFDWLVADANVAKVLDGKYDNKAPVPASVSTNKNVCQQPDYSDSSRYTNLKMR